MLANRVRMSRLLDDYPVATDEDFSGTTDGEFKYIGTATRLVIPHVIKGVPVTSYASMFSSTTYNSLEVRSDNPNVTNMRTMFLGCSSLKSLDLSSFNTSNVTDMGYMFYGCPGLKSLDVSNFDTSNVTNMSQMFNGSSATTFDLSSFDTSNVTDMSSMFNGCSGLTSLDLSSFNTSNVTDMSYMFYGCNKLTTAYAKTQEDADKLNASKNKPSNVNFIVKE